MFVLRSVLLGLFALHVSLTVAAAAPVILYDGSDVPTAQGWTRSSTGGTETVGSGSTRFVTTGSETPVTAVFNTYAFATGATDFVVSIRLSVAASGFNQYDGALVFSAFGSDGWLGADRDRGLMIGETAVAWGDSANSDALVNTGTFHEYAFRYLGGTLDVYIDSAFDSIVGGTATPVLSRAAVPPAHWSVGTIVFGDNTNDVGYGSDYIVDFVKFQNLALVQLPEPAALAMLVGALGWMARRRAKQTRG